MTEPTLAARRRDADLARDRLHQRVQQLQQRLQPATIVEQVRGELKRNAENGAERVTAEVRKRPVAFGLAAVGAAALLVLPRLLARKRTATIKGDRPGHGDDDGGQEQASGRPGRKRRR